MYRSCAHLFWQSTVSNTLPKKTRTISAASKSILPPIQLSRLFPKSSSDCSPIKTRISAREFLCFPPHFKTAHLGWPSTTCCQLFANWTNTAKRIR
jgi:hypothetical protein